MEAVRVKKSALGLVLAVVMLLLAAPGAAFASTPPSVELGDPQQNDFSWNFPNAKVTDGVSDDGTTLVLKTLTVSITGAGTISRPAQAAAKDASNTSATFIVTNAYEANILLKDVYFTGCNMTTTIRVTVDANETTDVTTLPTGTTLSQVGDHYYMYVPNTKLSWTAAYNAAKSYKYNGMQGYLATITSDAEYEALHNRVGSQSGWIGGTLMLKSDYSKINDDAELNRVAGAFVYKADAAYDDTKATAIKDYYWACGPEAGQSVTIDTHSNGEPNAFQHTGYDQPWSGMDNTLSMTKYECCLTANNEGGWTINDITESGYQASGYADGFFVEFGGYKSDPGQPDANKTKTVEYNFAHTHELTYSANTTGNQITVKCANGDGLCTIPADGLTLTLLDGEKQYYDGEVVEALGTSAERSAWTAAGLEFPAVSITHSDTEEGTYSTVRQVRNAGYYKIEVNVGAVTASSTYSIGKRPCAAYQLVVKDKVYDGNTTGELDASGTKFAGDIGGDDLNVTAKCTFSDKNVGKDKIVTISNIELTGKDACNYNLMHPSEVREERASITQREVTLTWGSDELVYNGSNQAPACTLGNVVEDDRVDVVVIGDGPYAGKVCRATADSLTGTDASNYKLPATGLTKDFIITKREVTLTWGETSFTYDGEEHVPTCTLGNLVGEDEVNVTVTGGQTDAGENLTATATKLDSSNYKLPATGTTTTFSIAKAPIEPTVSIEGWTYGDEANAPSIEEAANPGGGAVTYEYAARSDEDALSEDDWSTEAPTAAGDYTVRAAIAETANYEGATTTAEFTIAQREVTLTWDETPLTYNGTEQVPGCTAGNLVEGDTVKVTVKGAKTDAGEGYTATAASLDNNNYKLPAAGTTATFSIAPKSIDGAKVVLGPSLTANGKEQEQAIESVTLADGTVLDSGDFAVSGNKVTDAGTYKLAVIGTGNYTGTVEVEFTIAASHGGKEGSDEGKSDKSDAGKKGSKKKIPGTGDDSAAIVVAVAATGAALAAGGAATRRRTAA